MKGIDTNILVRYLTRDEPAQWARAQRYIQDTGAAGEQCLINVIVLCETVWILRSFYGVQRDTIAAVLEKILTARQFEVEDKDLAWAALREYRATGADFADCLIGQRNRMAGCDETATFDKALRHLEHFKVL
ncbi:MAG: type II toxin-antitoxin system VapC family toxin [Armatimonadetes bacterium]|nr:type II toxin-antitoxin system VapC family toxin [Armatimonadota bacterium]